MTIWTILIALAGIAGGIFLFSVLAFFALAVGKMMLYKINHPQYLLTMWLPSEIVDELMYPLIEQKYLKWLFAPAMVALDGLFLAQDIVKGLRHRKKG